MEQSMSQYNWKGDGTPGGCDNHCIPHPCGPCITGQTQTSYLKTLEAKVELVKEVIDKHGCSSPKDCGLHQLAGLLKKRG